MTRIVIDAPTLFHLVAHELTVGSGIQLVAPQSVRSRTLDLLFAAVHEGHIDVRAVDEMQDAITRVKIRLLGDRVSRRLAWTLATENGWDSIMEAEHIALVRLQADALSSVDARMRSLAEAHVPVFPIETIVE